MRHTSVFYRLLNDGALIRLPFQVRIGTITTAAGAGIVEPGQAIAVHSMALAEAFLTPRKAASLVALSQELLDAAGSAAETLISRSLRASVSEAVDSEFISIIMAGVSPISSTDVALADLRRFARRRRPDRAIQAVLAGRAQRRTPGCYH